MIRFEAVSKRYPGGVAALSELTFAVNAGEMIILSGHSGAGKSTLLKMIASIEQPTRGAVFVNGQNITRLKRSAIPFLRRNLGLVFQDQKLLHDRTVFENVLLPLAIAGVSMRDSGRRVRAALDKVGLLDRERVLPIALSGGEQQRLAIARAIVARPSLLIADEPTAHLDDAAARAIAEMFHSFNQVGVTVLVATHHEALFAPFMTRRIALSHGSLVQ